MKEMSETALARGDRVKTVAQFREEAELLRALRHENLPRVVDVFEASHRHFLVMELIEGQTLNQLLDAHGGPLPERDVVDWGAQLCRVLAFLHSRNPPIIYRDLKPDNIMVETAGGRVKPVSYTHLDVYKRQGFVTADELDGEGYSVLTDTFENVRGANWRHPRGPESDIIGQDDLPVTLVSYDDARACLLYTSRCV